MIAWRLWLETDGLLLQFQVENIMWWTILKPVLWFAMNQETVFWDNTGGYEEKGGRAREPRNESLCLENIAGCGKWLQEER